MAVVASIGTDAGRAHRAAGIGDGLLRRVCAAIASLDPGESIDAVTEMVQVGLGVDRCEVVVGETVLALEAGVLPLMAGGERVGAILLWSRNGVPQFTAEQRAELVGIAGVLGLALQRHKAVAAERDRIAHDLHDSVGQLITGIGLHLAELLADQPGHVWETLRRVQTLVAQADREVRASIDGLLHMPINGGVDRAIAGLCADFQHRTGVIAEFEVFGASTRVAPALEDAMFRVVAEALVNVERHANATTVSVELHFGRSLVCVVEDDGVGLRGRDPFAAGRFGLRTMQRRIELVGGELQLTNAAPGGVRLKAVIPGRGTANGAGTGGGRR